MTTLLLVGVLQCVSLANPAKPENEVQLAHLRRAWLAGRDASLDAWPKCRQAIGNAANANRASAPAADSISGDALLRRVIAAVDAQPSIAAKVRHKVDLLGPRG